MSEFDEVFSEVTKAEADRKPVWVVGLKQYPGDVIPMIAWGPCRGFLHGPPFNGKQAVLVPAASEGHNVWVKPVEEVYETEAQADAAALKKCEKQVEDMKSVIDALRQPDMIVRE